MSGYRSFRGFGGREMDFSQAPKRGPAQKNPWDYIDEMVLSVWRLGFRFNVSAEVREVFDEKRWKVVKRASVYAGRPGTFVSCKQGRVRVRWLDGNDRPLLVSSFEFFAFADHDRSQFPQTGGPRADPSPLEQIPDPLAALLGDMTRILEPQEPKDA